MTIDDDQAKYYSPPLDIWHLAGLFLPRTTNDIFNTGVHCLYILERVPALSTHSSYLILHAIVAGLYLAFIKLPAVPMATLYYTNFRPGTASVCIFLQQFFTIV